MNKIRGNYFDGKNSKSTEVNVSQRGNFLEIVALDGSFKTEWNLLEVKSNNFSSTKRVTLQYGDFPHECLEFDDENADLIRQIHRNEGGVRLLEFFVTQSSPVKIVTLSILVLVATIASYVFLISPTIGEQAAKLVPKSIESKVGEVVYRNMDKYIDRDSTKSFLLSEFFEACHFQSDYNIHFTYSKNTMVNAFALPGGRIVIFDGIVKKTQNWEELAALIAHELAHVNQRHSLKSISKALSSYLLVSVLTGDVAGTSTVILENASQINEMANSRVYEKEADIVGFEYLVSQNINPIAMAQLFERLKDGDEEISDLDKGMEFMSTHPLTQRRIEYIEEMLEEKAHNIHFPTNERAKEIWRKLKGE